MLMVRKISAIINDIIRKYDVVELNNIEKKNIEVSNSIIKIKNIIERQGINKDGFIETKIKPDKTFRSFFDRYSIDRQDDKGIFYSFKKIKDVHKILEGQLYLPYLTRHLENDPLEFFELLNITNPAKIVFDRKYMKDNIFIHCFTKDFREKGFWNTYGINKETNRKENIAIGFRFKKKIDFKELFHIIEFRDVIYNSGSRFDFIKEMQIRLFSEFGKILNIDSEFEFAKVFKREKYIWEDEMRLCFDLNHLKFLKIFQQIYPGFCEYDFESVFTKMDNAISVQMDNAFFEIKVCELICGNEISENDFNDLEEIANRRNIPIWKYK